MARVLLLFAHPALEGSRVHRRLLREVPGDVTVHDLYDAYPDFDIDVPREQALLSAHDVLVVRHPFYWYSVPPLLKQWIDLVLEHGWAYGSGRDALRGKWVVPVVSTGGGAEAYAPTGRNRFTMRQLMAPLDQTFTLCQMGFAAPFVVHGAHRLTPADIDAHAPAYRRLLDALRDDALDLDDARTAETLNPAVDALRRASAIAEIRDAAPLVSTPSP